MFVIPCPAYRQADLTQGSSAESLAEKKTGFPIGNGLMLVYTNSVMPEDFNRASILSEAVDSRLLTAGMTNKIMSAA
jgi:hypothetical protein